MSLSKEILPEISSWSFISPLIFARARRAESLSGILIRLVLTLLTPPDSVILNSWMKEASIGVRFSQSRRVSPVKGSSLMYFRMSRYTMAAKASSTSSFEMADFLARRARLSEICSWMTGFFKRSWAVTLLFNPALRAASAMLVSSMATSAAKALCFSDNGCEILLKVFFMDVETHLCLSSGWMTPHMGQNVKSSKETEPLGCRMAVLRGLR